VDKKANDTFAFDLENRLDDFFSDALPSQDEPPADGTPARQTDIPLKDLKSTILAIDWEITDDVLDTFIGQINELLEKFEDDKVIHTLLKLLKSLGKYVRSHKSKAHPDTIKRIMAVYSSLEKSVTDHDMSRNEKEKMVLEEVRQFQRLKATIVSSKAASVASSSQKTIESGEMPGFDAVISAIDELKSMMARELSTIREALGQLSKK
jgi:flagellar biosynthesis regulator FlbT